jgi:two-component system sensor histidine kinase/response regulator
LGCDLILLDAHMPDLDGFELAAQLRILPGSGETPLIMLSSAGLKGDAQRSREVGFDAYLSKPFTRQDLIHVISRVFRDSSIGPADLVPRQATMGEQTPLHVLLVEDNVVNQKLAIALLSRWGHRVTVANDGQLALKALAQRRFDLVLMDMIMPVMDGLEATRLYRASEQGPRTPIIAMTANAMPGDRADCLAAGMDDYLSKPIETTELQRLLQQHMFGPLPGLPHSLAIKTTDLTPRTSPQSAFDYDAALSASDEEVVHIITDVFMDQWPIDLDQLNQSIGSGEREPLKHVAHALKGTLAMIGALPAAEIARQIEVQSGNGTLESLAGMVSGMVAEVDQLIAALRRAKP